MDKLGRGKHIISAAKSLKGFPNCRPEDRLIPLWYVGGWKTWPLRVVHYLLEWYARVELADRPFVKRILDASA